MSQDENSMPIEVPVQSYVLQEESDDELIKPQKRRRDPLALTFREKRGRKVVSAYYKGKLPGNSPENCRALDSHGFADLKMNVVFSTMVHAFFRANQSADQSHRFSMATPSAVESAMFRCWEVAPNPERIRDDIMGAELVWAKILAADGVAIPDAAFRNGKRLATMEQKVSPSITNCSFLLCMAT